MVGYPGVAMPRPTRLFIQIPCFNEEETLPGTLADLPTSVPGIDEIAVLVIDDGSTDRTAEIARAHGVQHVLRFPRNRGLARAFTAGIDACLRLGADYIVNTDADNQYPGGAIPDLLAPLLAGEAEMVIGDRQTHTVADFSPTKRLLQRVGSWVVRKVSGTAVPDAVSGFRALTREAALRLFIVTDYTYTIESIIQAGSHRTAIASVPITVNPRTRDSRLVSSVGDYVSRSVRTILRVYTMYQPLRVFLPLAALLLVPALVIGVRFIVAWVAEPDVSRHVQSLIAAAILTTTAVNIVVFALVADLVAANRKLLEDTLVRVKRLELSRSDPP